ncbi:MAG: hypothetical protein GY820_01235, partial [Gammaproteobacteria bacterium]|nr:hypothetical protein [Gammaproteobacteria bacterium]
MALKNSFALRAVVIKMLSNLICDFRETFGLPAPPPPPHPQKKTPPPNPMRGGGGGGGGGGGPEKF